MDGWGARRGRQANPATAATSRTGAALLLAPSLPPSLPHPSVACPAACTPARVRAGRQAGRCKRTAVARAEMRPWSAFTFRPLPFVPCTAAGRSYIGVPSSRPYVGSTYYGGDSSWDGLSVSIFLALCVFALCTALAGGPCALEQSPGRDCGGCLPLCGGSRWALAPYCAVWCAFVCPAVTAAEGPTSGAVGALPHQVCVPPPPPYCLGENGFVRQHLQRRL